MVEDRLQIELPAFSGTRDEADRVYEALKLHADDSQPVSVTLYGRDVMITTDSFVDQLVMRLEQAAGVSLNVTTVGAPERLQRQLQEAFRRYKLSPKALRVATTA